MKKQEVLKLIREYQDYSKINDYPKGEDEINEEDLMVHEEIATALRQELEQNPDFFRELNDAGLKEYIKSKHLEKREQTKKDK